MTEEETKKFLANNANNLLMRIGTIDGKGEPNVTVTAFYFHEPSEKIFVVTQKDSKKVQHLKNRNIISYCIDDPNPPYTGARGKGTVKFLVDIQENIPLATKYCNLVGWKFINYIISNHSAMVMENIANS